MLMLMMLCLADVATSFTINTCTQQSTRNRRYATSTPATSTEIVASAASSLTNRFMQIDLHTKMMMRKIISLYEEERVDTSAFHGVNGYGHGDLGREKLDRVVAKLLGAEVITLSSSSPSCHHQHHLTISITRAFA